MTQTRQSPFKAHLSGTSFRRLCMTAIPAGVVTVSLFVAMQTAVEVDDFEPPEQTVYLLDPYMEQPRRDEPETPDTKPKPPVDIEPPPRPPNLVKDIKLVDVPPSDYFGGAPADYGEADVHLIAPQRATSVIDRRIVPITPPVPVYPSRLAALGIEGFCEVVLSVTTRGDPFNVNADCTDRRFERAAKNAVQKVKFAPKIRDGLPVTVTGVVYPLEFRLEP